MVKPEIPEEKPSPELKPEVAKPKILESPENPVEKTELKKPVEPKKEGVVTVKVLIGTLSWVGGTYEKGETFEIDRKELERFDPRYYRIL